MLSNVIINPTVPFMKMITLSNLKAKILRQDLIIKLYILLLL